MHCKYIYRSTKFSFRFALKSSISMLVSNFAFFCLIFLFKVIASIPSIQIKNVMRPLVMRIISIGIRNQWNEFNDCQIHDLSRTHAHRTSAINYRHQWTLNRTLMHSVISCRFIVLLHASSCLSIFHHPAFLSRISPRIVIRRANHLNSAVRKVSSTIAQYSTLRYDLHSCYKIIALDNPDRIILAKNKGVKGNIRDRT